MPAKDKETKYDFSFDGVTAWETYRAYRRKLLVEASGITDESGGSLADFLLGVDMGGAAGSLIPGGAAGTNRQDGTPARRKSQEVIQDDLGYYLRPVEDFKWLASRT